MGGSIPHTHMRTGSGAQCVTVLNDSRCRRIGRHSVNVSAVVEPVGVRSKTSRGGRTVFQENHLCFLLLQHKHSQWSFLCIGWAMLPRGGRIHTPDETASFFFSFHGSNILIVAIHKDCFVEHYRIGNQFHVFGRCIPFIAYKDRFYFGEAAFFAQVAGEQTIQPIPFCSNGIIRQEKRYALVTFYSQCIGYSFIGIPSEFLTNGDSPLRFL